jgi:hypothetical protein
MTAQVIHAFKKEFTPRGSITISPGVCLTWDVQHGVADVSISSVRTEMYSDTIDIETGRSLQDLLLQNAIGERNAFEEELRKCHAKRKTGFWQWWRR